MLRLARAPSHLEVAGDHLWGAEGAVVSPCMPLWPALRRAVVSTCMPRWRALRRLCTTGPASHLVVGGPVDAPGLLTSDDLHRAYQEVNVRLRIERVESAVVSTCMHGRSSALW